MPGDITGKQMTFAVNSLVSELSLYIPPDAESRHSVQL